MIYILCGKSASGKDTIKNELLDANKYGNQFKPIITCTTRPRREGEVDGIDYIFLPDDVFMRYVDNNEIFEYREYKTLVKGKRAIWKYGSMRISRWLLKEDDYICVLDPPGVKTYIKEYGKDLVFVILLECGQPIRKLRAMQRGSFDETEWNRRQEADDKTFANPIFECGSIIIDSSGPREEIENIAACISILAEVNKTG